MSRKFLLLSALAYFILTMLIAVPWHFMFFKELYHELGIYNREPPIVPLGMLSMVIQGLILGYLYPWFHKTGKPLVDGIKYGLVMGLFLFSVSTLANVAKMQVSSIADFVIVQAAFHFIQFVVAGAAIGFLYEKLKK